MSEQQKLINEIVEYLKSLAKDKTAGSEFGPDEHFCGIAADLIEQLKKENEILKCVQCNDKGMVRAGPCQDGLMYSIKCAHINQR